MSSQLHVMHVIRSLEIGGMERLVFELVQHRTQGTSSVLCLERQGHFGNQLREAGVPIRVVGTKGNLANRLWRMQGQIADLKPDVLHCHNLLALTHAGLLRSAKFAPRIVATKHGRSVPSTKGGGRVCRWLARRTRMVAVSLEIQQSLHQWCRSTRFPVSVIPNGITAEAFRGRSHREPVRRMLGCKPHNFVIGIVARLAEEKDHQTLLKAFQQLNQERPETRLVIIGDGPLREPLEQLAANGGTAPSIRFLGERHDIPHLLSGLDVFALSSRTEGLPMTVLEAMAAGLPIVASQVGGVPAAVENGVTGWLVPAGAPLALAQALKFVAQDKHAAHEMGQAGRKKLEREFSVSHTAARYEEVYHAV